ncbi:undecaprenyl pyrophosphate synthase [Clostridium tetanomorphum]|uniref:CdiI immunity protein domain-containing protein n=1 Tax=Clostridium tetanomorphum TaxID=1553 RepID=A0A923EDC3_CLOTT|nr:hypothetical protein [Clostridium tetanomorphum]KAJ53007.1 hypothetical protein CTM_05118 [Clostridium tetanomorphum DSM 665]MBC2398540.1 hypothetical protein [Clostridium tetanomorphum]MBP1864950.1 undecaprenyl pyrophosphate synthase [Clostridium tetanomorphum]NRS83156.1 undecaprenyl pyrophosphate synthase [Clostridium tetanomorphum]NRZ98743.1 undecaprenyl pyrophosphate synthase [Clostridium tetanomorphum]
MFNIEDLLAEDFAAYPEEVRVYLENFSYNLREALKEELVEHIGNEMLKDIEMSKDNFMMKLTSILNYGHKGYNNMTTKALLDLYLEIKQQKDFISLLDKVSNEV